MPIENTIPTKKNSLELKAYQNVGPKFGDILYKTYKNLAGGMESDSALRIYKHDILRWSEEEGLFIRFPFETIKNSKGNVFGKPWCVSPNDTIAHDKDIKVKAGDIVSYDFGIAFNYPPLGYYLCLDAAFTIKTDKKKEDLWIDQPLNTLQKIVSCNFKNTRDISRFIEENTFVEKQIDTRTGIKYGTGLKVVASLTGHGIGESLHEAPAIYNFPYPYVQNTILFNGLCFCVEPIYVNEPKELSTDSNVAQTCISSDGWTVYTVSGCPSTHWETTYAVIDGQIIDVIGITNWNI
jgi:methionine aminopeptidase